MLKEAYSTPIFPLDILAERPPVKKFEWVSNHSAALNILVYLSFWYWYLDAVSGAYPNVWKIRILSSYGSG